MKENVAERFLSLYAQVVSVKALCFREQISVYECVKASLHFSNSPYYSKISSKLTSRSAGVYHCKKNYCFLRSF